MISYYNVPHHVFNNKNHQKYSIYHPLLLLDDETTEVSLDIINLIRTFIPNDTKRTTIINILERTLDCGFNKGLIIERIYIVTSIIDLNLVLKVVTTIKDKKIYNCVLERLVITKFMIYV